jgi:hypothetical protein
MELWRLLIQCLWKLQKACSRKTTFMWMATVVMGLMLRPDLLGVTSFVRALILEPSCYRLLLHLFHSQALKLALLTRLWIEMTLKLFQPVIEGGYLVLLADGLKAPKEGRKMPAVKCLHQESASNSKPTYIMGHSFQALAMLVSGGNQQHFAVTLLSRICEGVVLSPKDNLTLLDKMAGMCLEAAECIAQPILLVADAYYASRKVIIPLLEKGHHLLTRARINSVAYYQASVEKERRRGRKRVYGEKVRLRNLFKSKSAFISAKSPVYGERDVTIQYRSLILLWRPIGRQVRFVLVRHPSRGRMILMCTNLDLDELSIIRLYGLRFKIEVSFKQAVHTIGTYAYHFWMKIMKPIKRGSGNQKLINRNAKYRKSVERKIGAYHKYVQLSCIAQGLLMHLAINYRQKVWAKFGSWLRTMRTDLIPSEMVVAQALKSSFFEFLLSSKNDCKLKKFILDRADYDRMASFLKAA